MKAIKPVITGPEQSMSEPAQWGGLKSPALVVLETTRYPTQRKNSPFENNQIQTSGKGGYQTQSGGTDGGTNWLLILQNLAFMRVSSHHSSGFTSSPI